MEQDLDHYVGNFLSSLMQTASDMEVETLLDNLGLREMQQFVWLPTFACTTKSLDWSV